MYIYAIFIFLLFSPYHQYNDEQSNRWKERKKEEKKTHTHRNTLEKSLQNMGFRYTFYMCVIKFAMDACAQIYPMYGNIQHDDNNNNKNT